MLRRSRSRAGWWPPSAGAAPSGQDSRSADSLSEATGLSRSCARRPANASNSRLRSSSARGVSLDLFFVRRDSADGPPAENQHDQEDDNARGEHPDHVDTLEDSSARHRPIRAGALDGDQRDDSALKLRVIVEIRGHPRSRFGVAVLRRQRKHLGLRRLEAGDQPLRLAPGGLLTRQLDQRTVSVPRLLEIRGGPVELAFDLGHPAGFGFEDMHVEQNVLLVEIAGNPRDQLDAHQGVPIQAAGLDLQTTLSRR